MADHLQEELIERSLRPRSFKEFVGQEQEVGNLKVFIKAAHQRLEALDHVLLHGPPGLGKSSLAHLIASECGRQLRTTSGPVITKAGDLAAILTSLQPMDVLFIDEIHRLPISVEELLYSAMEDYRIDILVGEGPHARSLQMRLSPFTLVGATTRSGLLSSPLRDRFGIVMPLTFYTPEELHQLLMVAAAKMNMSITKEASYMIAGRCRSTPRIALRLLRRVRDFAHVGQSSAAVPPAVLPIVSPNTLPISPPISLLVTEEMTTFALSEMGISQEGLDGVDLRYLSLLALQGGPTGLETLAAAMSETRDTLEDVIEPYLLQQGFLQRTPRGRKLTEKAREALLLNRSRIHKSV